MSEREQDSCETCADIADQIRRAVESMGDELPYTVSAGTMRRVADRIEAAWRREKAEIEANALAVGGIVEAARHKPGNAAAIRAALNKIRRELNTYCKDSTLIDRMTEDPPDYTCLRDSLLEIERIVDAALSAPARNCDQIDLPNDCNCKTIHLSDRIHMLNTDSRGDHEWDDEVCSLEFVGKSGGDEWLVHGREGAAWACECEVLAPAAEKGENDGHKKDLQ